MPKKNRPRILVYIKMLCECRTWKQAEELLDNPDFRQSEGYLVIKAMMSVYDN